LRGGAEGWCVTVGAAVSRPSRPRVSCVWSLEPVDFFTAEAANTGGTRPVIRVESGTRPVVEAGADSEFVAVGVEDGHVSQALESLAGGVFDGDVFLLEFGVPGVDVRDVEVDECAGGAVAGVLGEEERHPVAVDLHEDGEVGLEAVFPVYLEAEAFDVEGFAAEVVGDAKSGDDSVHGRSSGSRRLSGRRGAVGQLEHFGVVPGEAQNGDSVAAPAGLWTCAAGPGGVGAGEGAFGAVALRKSRKLVGMAVGGRL
jgi:hypothetical protein